MQKSINPIEKTMTTSVVIGDPTHMDMTTPEDPQKYVPLHIEYADDVDVLCSSKEEAPRILGIAKTVLGTYNLMLNETKTEIIEYKKGSDLRKIKKLGTILDEGTELSRRKQLATLALYKYRKIWKNQFIRVKKKINI